MGNAPPSRGAAASLSRGELGAVVAIVLMLRRWARSSWRGVFAYARSWRSSCLRTCGHYDGGTGSRHEGASSLWRGWPIRRADLPLPRAGLSIRRAGSPLRKSNLPLRRAGSPLRRGDLPLRRGDLRQECHKSGDNVMKNETGRVYGIFRSVFPAGIPRIACLYSGCFEIRYIIARFAASGHRFCRCRRPCLGLWGRFAHQLLGSLAVGSVCPSVLGSSAFRVGPSIGFGVARPIGFWVVWLVSPPIILRDGSARQPLDRSACRPEHWAVGPIWPLALGLAGQSALGPAGHQLLGLNPRSRRALPTTQRLERLIAAAPNMGESCHPNSG